MLNVTGVQADGGDESLSPSHSTARSCWASVEVLPAHCRPRMRKSRTRQGTQAQETDMSVRDSARGGMKFDTTIECECIRREVECYTHGEKYWEEMRELSRWKQKIRFTRPSCRWLQDNKAQSAECCLRCESGEGPCSSLAQCCTMASDCSSWRTIELSRVDRAGERRGEKWGEKWGM